MAISIKENIEMELFSSEEQCVVTLTQEEDEEKKGLYQRHSEHPLVPDSEGESGPRSQTQDRRHSKQLNTTSEKQESPGSSTQPVDPVEELLIEMEVLPSFRKSDHQQRASRNKANRLKWKRLAPQKSRFVVKDVVCLPKDQYLAQLESQVFSQRKEVATTTARITVDHRWSSSEMDSRLRMLFRRDFGKAAAKQLTFTYLQCVQSSKALFVSETPAEGWTGAQVLRISALGPLYVLINHDISQAKCEQCGAMCQSAEENRKVVCLETNREHKTQCKISKSSEEVTLELQAVLKPFTQHLALTLEAPLQVKRTEVLHTAQKAVRKSGFCFRTTPVVSFSGEETVGHEGPLREFFRLTLQELQQTSLFEGQSRRLFLTHDLAALEDWKYYEAGVLIGWSLAQGGPGPRCLHPSLYQVMCGHDVSLDDFNWRDVVDLEIQSHLQQLQTCSDVKLLSPNLVEWVSSCGVPDISSASSCKIPNIYRRVVKHYIYDRVASVIFQFVEGLNSCDGLWDLIKSHCEAFKPVMTSTNYQPLTLKEFKQLFTVSFTSPDQEELRAAEEETVRHWETVLGLISDGQVTFSFEDLLAFISGASHLPLLGFSSLISLRFYAQDAVLSSVRLPFASTCTLELYLPRAIGGDVELLMLLTRAVHESLGFTRLNKEDLDACI